MKSKSKKRCQVWAFGGGKGGIGKSLITANMAMYMAMMGKKVVAVDLDLGSANLHTHLGISIPSATLSDFIYERENKIEKLMTPVYSNNLFIISGAQDELDVANMKEYRKERLISRFKKINADYVFLDLGAGCSYHTLDFFIAADKRILIITPEPTAIENAHRFVKSLFLRRFKSVGTKYKAGPLISKVLNAKQDSKKSPAKLIKHITDLNFEVGNHFQNEIDMLYPNIIVNQVRCESDILIGRDMSVLYKRYLGMDSNYAGHLEYDTAVWQCVRKRKTVITEHSNSTFVGSLKIMTNSLM